MKVAIIGGGASGVICAITIKKNNPNVDVVIFEQNDRILKKLLKTGNGRCNITNKSISLSNYNNFSLIQSNMDKVDVLKELSSLGLVIKELTNGRMYPYSEQANTVLNVLQRNLSLLNITTKCNVNITKENIKKTNNGYIVNDETFDYLVIATGSKSQSQTKGYEILESLHHIITPLTPGLVPLVTKEETKHLSGLKSKCKCVINDLELVGEILYRNDGLSGILTLDISRYVKKNDVISFDLMYDYSIDELYSLFKERDAFETLIGIFPKLLAQEIVNRSKNQEISSIIQTIKNFTFTITSKKGFDESQITIGGVKVEELNNDFSSKINKNLFICGEVIDVDGMSGGYNLYFAWLSGIVTGKKIAKTIS